MTFAPDWPALRQRRIFLASPLYGNQMTFGFHRSVLELSLSCLRSGIHLGHKYVGCDSLVPRARNRLLAYFLRSDSTDLLFIDSDISFTTEDLFSVIASDEPIIGAAYPRKQLDWTRIAAAARAGVPAEQLAYYGFIPVMNWGASGDFALDALIPSMRHLGTGFLRIRREVITDMISKLGSAIQFDYSGDEPIFKGEVGYDLFPIGPDVRYPVGSGGRQYLSEDWGFSELARQCGYRLALAPWIKLTHSGYMDYVGSLDVMDFAVEEALANAPTT